MRLQALHGRGPHGQARTKLREDAQREDHDRAEHGHRAHQRVEHEDDGGEYGRPGNVEKREDRGAAHELADVVDVPHRLAGGLPLAGEVAAEGAGEHIVGHVQAERQADALHQALAHPFEQAEAGQQKHGDEREHQQRLRAGAGEHPVVHLQHVHRRHQHQDVDQRTEHRDGDEAAAVFAQRGAQRRCGTFRVVRCFGLLAHINLGGREGGRLALPEGRRPSFPTRLRWRCRRWPGRPAASRLPVSGAR